jgi:hypothetical protein
MKMPVGWHRPRAGQGTTGIATVGRQRDRNLSLRSLTLRIMQMPIGWHHQGTSVTTTAPSARSPILSLRTIEGHRRRVSCRGRELLIRSISGITVCKMGDSGSNVKPELARKVEYYIAILVYVALDGGHR